MCAFQNDEENNDYHLEVQTVAETDDLFAEHSDDEVLLHADAATPRFTRQEAWDRERFFLGHGPGTDNPMGFERETCFVCMVITFLVVFHDSAIWKSPTPFFRMARVATVIHGFFIVTE